MATKIINRLEADAIRAMPSAAPSSRQSRSGVSRGAVSWRVAMYHCTMTRTVKTISIILKNWLKGSMVNMPPGIMTPWPRLTPMLRKVAPKATKSETIAATKGRATLSRLMKEIMRMAHMPMASHISGITRLSWSQVGSVGII